MQQDVKDNTAPLTRRRMLTSGTAAIAGLVAMSGGSVSAATLAQRARNQSTRSEEAEQLMAQVLIAANTAMAKDTLQDRLAGVEQLVDQYADLRRTGRFTLGQYARQMTDTQASEYYRLFRKFAATIYQDLLSQYSGEELVVTGSVQRSPRDIIVNSKVANAKPGEPFADTVFQWRLYKSRSDLKVVDAGADNVWLAIEQRSQFTSVIANNGGGTRGIDALIAQLKDRVEG